MSTMCKNELIKELLPEYGANQLGPDKQKLVELHLASCVDCREELSLFRMMAEEPVHDPGEAYWAYLPNRVYRAVQEEKASRASSRLSSLWNLFVRMRPLTLGMATAAILIIATAVVVQTVDKKPAPAVARTFELPGTTISTDSDEPIKLSEVDQNTLVAMDGWVGKQFAALGHEVDRAADLSPDSDISDELAELDTTEIDRLSQIITRAEEET